MLSCPRACHTYCCGPCFAISDTLLLCVDHDSMIALLSRAARCGIIPSLQVALVDIRGQVIKHRDEGSDFFSTAYEGMRAEYLDAHIPGAVFVDWTKVG